MIKIYGRSDDLVEIDGDIQEEFGCYNKCEEGKGVIVACSDGSLWSVRYGDGDLAIWRVTPLSKGSAPYEKFEATSDDGDYYSDVVTINGDISWVSFGYECAVKGARA